MVKYRQQGTESARSFHNQISLSPSGAQFQRKLGGSCNPGGFFYAYV